AIGRAVGSTTGTASKWRVRYAEKRLAGLDETGERGAEPKYTTATNKRILALLDQTPPEGYARWTGPLLGPRSTMSMSNMSGVSCARDRPRRAKILVREQRSRVRRQGRRRGRA